MGGRILVNLLRKLFRHKVLVTSTGKHILGQCDDNFCTEMKKDDQIYVGKKLKHWPQVLALPCHPGVDHVLLIAKGAVANGPHDGQPLPGRRTLRQVMLM